MLPSHQNLAGHAVNAYCQKCGASLRLPASFCDNCGVALDSHPPLRLEFGPAVRAIGAQPDAIAGVFDRYAVLRAIGEGGMGLVVEVMDPWSGQRFALKLVNAAQRLRRSAVAALEREAQTQASLVHPNVVRVFSVVADGKGRLGVLRELVDGASLDSVLEERAGRPFSSGQLRWLMHELAVGLDVVHLNGYVHADVKPGNFIYGTSNVGPVLKITDFGIATSLRDELRRDGDAPRSGTPVYMPPEQWAGRALSPASDVYALGCVYYELLVGAPPFVADELDELMLAHTSANPIPPSAIRRETDPTLERLVLSMLHKDPERRPRSARDLLHALST